MQCIRCQHEISDDANYCASCGFYQRTPDRVPLRARRLTRIDGKIAGVCAGLANYFDVDVTFVRLAWVVLSIVPGAIVGGVRTYLVAWLVMPEGGAVPAGVPPRSRLVRSPTDRKIAGVCGGLAEYFGVDSTPIRLLWLGLSILPGAIVGGLIAYLAAWLIVPKGPAPALTSNSTAVSPMTP